MPVALKSKEAPTHPEGVVVVEGSHPLVARVCAISIDRLSLVASDVAFLAPPPGSRGEVFAPKRVGFVPLFSFLCGPVPSSQARGTPPSLDPRGPKRSEKKLPFRLLPSSPPSPFRGPFRSGLSPLVDGTVFGFDQQGRKGDLPCKGGRRPGRRLHVDRRDGRANDATQRDPRSRCRAGEGRDGEDGASSKRRAKEKDGERNAWTRQVGIQGRKGRR